ncbi:hypothetical protein PENSPDRAFT_645154 [Peniophora sp. CONT]|nr:hypothetical protein PENSPDRAFT_645154 [Peniophora sp. CONT]
MAHSPSPRRSSSVDRVPLSPCLVHHDHDHDCDHPPRHRPVRARRPSLPDPIMRSPSSPGAVELATIPLRPCCVQCLKVTEACLAHGDAWRERFTRAARNRRNASIDFQMARQNRSPVVAPTPGSFAAVTVDEVAKEGIILHDSPDADVLHDEEAQSPRLVVEEDETWATSVPADVLGAGLTRRMLSPIPSRNVSTEELLVSRKPSAAAEEVTYEDLVKADTLPVSPPSSPPLRTPSPPERSVSSSPKHRFKFPASSELLRAGVDMFKGVGSFSPTPV